jgi:Peptidase family M28
MALSNDDLQGRDTGSEGYRKAAAYVVKQFDAAGLQPAGEDKSWYQTVPMRSVRFRADLSEVGLVRQDGSTQPLKWLQQISIPARLGTPESIDAALVFDGQPEAGSTAIYTRGKMLVRLNTGGGRRGTAAGGGVAATGALGTLTVDTTSGPEPPRWPVQYAVSVSIAGTPPAQPAGGPGLALRFNPKFADLLFAGSGHTYRELMDLAAAGKPLPCFELPLRLHARMKFESGELRSDNILGVLRGSDPVLANEYVVISAHLDGYGLGSPWEGDNIYNGSFDDAAYVATMIEFAQKLKESGTKLKRSVLFGVWTGEEKGLLGSKWYVTHPTLPKESFVANVNLDQLRPIFPLKILTTLAVDDSTLGDTVREVAGAMDIRIQPDPEPERNLLRRSDHWNFMGIGVPAVGFIFGYEKGTPEEATYRQWYALRYHTPLDDLKQPWDPPAAAKFNDFFGRVVQAIANAPERPKWKPGSPYAPK